MGNFGVPAIVGFPQISAVYGISGARMVRLQRSNLQSSHDRGIGKNALVHHVPAIVSWNVSHMRTLLPPLRVVIPRDL